ncbi:Heterochromatin protein 1 [Halotydeus destructor]|nr:Heterochromatin protein 1 [Halotydeus destructor]
MPSKKKKAKTSSETFTVERILDKRIRDDGKTEYYLKWADYPESSNSWEPREFLMCVDLIDDFERKYAKRLTGQSASDTGGKANWTSADPCQSSFDRGLVADKILGVVLGDDGIHYLVQWKDHSGAELVHSSIVSKQCPQLVINYYQRHISWCA